MLDYSEPGVLGAFTDERTLARLQERMAAKGHLEGSQLAGTFDLLRASDPFFSYVVKGWPMGQDPPAFDLLAQQRQHSSAGRHALVLVEFPAQGATADLGPGSDSRRPRSPILTQPGPRQGRACPTWPLDTAISLVRKPLSAAATSSSSTQCPHAQQRFLPVAVPGSVLAS